MASWDCLKRQLGDWLLVAILEQLEQVLIRLEVASVLYFRPNVLEKEMVAFLIHDLWDSDDVEQHLVSSDGICDLNRDSSTGRRHF